MYLVGGMDVDEKEFKRLEGVLEEVEDIPVLDLNGKETDDVIKSGSLKVRTKEGEMVSLLLNYIVKKEEL